MVTTISLVTGLVMMVMIPKMLSQVQMFILMKSILVTINSIKLLKVSQVIDSNVNGQVFLEFQKVVNFLSKLDQMMDLDFGLMMLWLLIIGVFMEQSLEKEIFNFLKVIII